MWVAGWNLPGYLPDDDVHEFDSWEDATAFMRDELETAAEHAREQPMRSGVALADGYRSLAAEVATAEGPEWDAQSPDGWAFWIVTAD